MHPHEAVAQAMGGGSMLNGAPRPEGEELGEITRLLAEHHEFGLIFIPLIVTYFVVLRCFFKSWTISEATRKYKTGESFEGRYTMAFDRRNQLESQLNWATSRGDEGASSVLRSQLADLDLEIDKLEGNASKARLEDSDPKQDLPGAEKLNRRNTSRSSAVEGL